MSAHGDETQISSQSRRPKNFPMVLNRVAFDATLLGLKMFIILNDQDNPIQLGDTCILIDGESQPRRFMTALVSWTTRPEDNTYLELLQPGVSVCGLNLVQRLPRDQVPAVVLEKFENYITTHPVFSK